MEDEQKIREINQWLLDEYGEPEEPADIEPVELVIRVILSQNTNDINRDKAFHNLEERYGLDYAAIENADLGELTDTVRIAGLGPTKAERIQGALEIIHEYSGDYSIEFLDEMGVEEAKEWLTDIPGVGPKSAAVILCFGFEKPVFPVDTHVHRLAKRYNLVPGDASRERTHDILEEKVPDDIKYELHRNLIEHGREKCTARKDNCDCELCERYGDRQT
ncbi:MAG: endonuclease III [Candidatus Nanohaloarchaea archaeon]